MAAGERWSVEQAQTWYAEQPWLVGCNFIPSTAVNQLEMWQSETFDLETIDRELSWAQELGFNTARVFLHDLLWEQDAEVFLARIDHFLTVAAQHAIRVLFVLFDGVWDPFPRLGPQPAPRARVHNSGWVQSPGVGILCDPSRHDELSGYVTGVVERFGGDPRVLGWDLFNEPNNPNAGSYGDHEPANKPELAFELLRKAFRWARSARPSQPLTAGLWRDRRAADTVSEIDRLMLNESDVISFHSYAPAEHVAARIDALSEYGRPLFLTEYLGRPYGSTFESLLPLLEERHVAAYNWGLVAGKTQTIYPWDSWRKSYSGEPDIWFHDILRPDGSAYRDEEAVFIRALVRGDPN